jgi:hypothetical protein
MHSRSFLSGLILGLCCICAPAASAQCVSLTTLGSAYTQTFDTLSNTAGSTTNNLTITGWFMTESGGGARDNEQYAVDTGASTTGDTYSYGVAAATERALGQIRSGTLIPIFGACFTNNTGSTIDRLSVGYNGEQWRFGGVHSTVPDKMDFQYSVNATDLVTGTWNDVNTLDFNAPVTTGLASALDGNAAANRTAISGGVGPLSIANGATFWIRWTDVDATGADDGLAIDDFSLTPFITTAAMVSVSGRVLDASGAGVRNARVSLRRPDGSMVFGVTNTFGQYVFEKVESGQSYILEPSVRGRVYASRVITVGDTLTGVDFIPQ